MNDDNAYKFTDSQVRADRELYEDLAVEYLRHYAGEFDLLLAYKQHLDRGSSLTVPMIRATLNCMRFDAQVAELPKPRVTVLNAGSRQDARVIDLTTRRVRVKSVKPMFIELPTHWNKTYGISHWVTARTVHRVDPASHFEYNTVTREFRCRLSWACTAIWSMPSTTIELLNDDEASELLRSWNGVVRLCATCQAKMWRMRR